MKKAWFILATVLIAGIFSISISYFAAAREITIAGYKYPAIILIPVISIIISFLIIISILVRVTKTRREILKKKRIKGKENVLIPFLGKRAREEKRQENIYLKEIKKFKRDLPKLSLDEGFDKVSNITKDFFKELLGLQYEFTYNELSKELRKKGMKKEFLELVETLSHMKYSGKKIMKQELENFAAQIENVIKKEMRRREEKELGVSKALTKRKRSIFARVAGLKREETKKERKERILELMKEEEEALKRDMNIARDIYHRILSSYYKLPPSERKEVYNRLMNFYKEINHMLFSSFYGKRSKRELEYFSKRLAKLKKEAEKVERVIQRKPSEKVKEAVERLKLPEIKIKPFKEIERKKRREELRKEREREKEELKKLEEIEKEAKERIKRISESVVKERMVTRPSHPAEKEKIMIREIKPKPIIKPAAVRMPAKPRIIRPTKLERPKIHEIKRKPEKKPAEQIKKVEVKKEKVPAHEIKPKGKKLGALEREEQAIRERLERLRKYVG